MEGVAAIEFKLKEKNAARPIRWFLNRISSYDVSSTTTWFSFVPLLNNGKWSSKTGMAVKKYFRLPSDAASDKVNVFPGWSTMMAYTCRKCSKVVRLSEDPSVERFFGPRARNSEACVGWATS